MGIFVSPVIIELGLEVSSMGPCSLAVIKDAQCTELFCGVAAIAKGFRNSSALAGFVDKCCKLTIEQMHSIPKVSEITRRCMVKIQV